MSDEGTEGAAAPAGPAEGSTAEALTQAAAAPAEAPAEAPVEAPAEADIDLDTPAADDVWADPVKAKAYGEKLRAEAAKNRVKAREATDPANDPFNGWSENDAAVLRETIQAAAADPKVGAAKMRQIAALLDGGDVEGAAEVAAGASEAAAEAARPLTEEDVEAKVASALEAAQKQRDIESIRDGIISKAKELGYETGSADYFTLLHIAQYEKGGDINAAHEAIVARDQAVVDRYVEAARNRSASMPIHGGKPEDSVIDPQGENKTWESGSDRVRQRLVNLRGKKA